MHAGIHFGGRHRLRVELPTAEGREGRRGWGKGAKEGMMGDEDTGHRVGAHQSNEPKGGKKNKTKM